MVIRTDDDRLRIEHSLYLVTDQVVDGLHIQFGCQPLLHAVDDGKFGSALLRLSEQALGLSKETNILNRDDSLICKGFQQLDPFLVQKFRFHAADRNASNSLYLTH